MHNYDEIMLFAPSFMKNISSIKPKSIVGTVYPSIFFCNAIGKHYDIPVVNFMQGYEPCFENGRPYGWAELACKSSQNILAISEFLKYKCKNNFNKESTVISNGINTDLLYNNNVQTNEKKIAFTMNCAWNADDIDIILETLKNNDVHITFFMVGSWVDKYPEAVKKIYGAGHEIGSHSNTHPHVNNLSAEKNLEEINLSANKIEKITGQKINLYRAPYGEYNDTVIQTAQENGYYTIQWN